MRPPTTSPSSRAHTSTVSRSECTSAALASALRATDQAFAIVQDADDRPTIIRWGSGEALEWPHDLSHLRAFVPAIAAQQLGDPGFRQAFGVGLAYVGGAMANGIASTQMVCALGNAGMLAEFGAAGLDLPTIASSIDALNAAMGSRAWACNLIHSPQEPELETATVDLYLQRNLKCVSASAFMDIRPDLVRYRFANLQTNPAGGWTAPHRLIAKVSRVEVARKFMSPPSAELLRELVTRGALTTGQAQWAATQPLAQALTVEADSGGHTDNRPSLAQFPAMVALRERLTAQWGYREPIYLGAAGGIGTPQAITAAFALGAAYVVTGSINQSCIEAGTSDLVRALLARTEQADVAMAPAGDMFEMGVKVQVLKRGTMFAMRAQRLYDLYRSHRSLDEISTDDLAFLEGQIFRTSLAQAWESTAAYWRTRDVATLQRAQVDAKHQMALLFRSYLGLSSRWAKEGLRERQADFQIWCGPAIGAFNEWVKDSPLEAWPARRVVLVAHALMRGAAVLTRAAMLRQQGFAISDQALGLRPNDLLDSEELHT